VNGEVSSQERRYRQGLFLVFARLNLANRWDEVEVHLRDRPTIDEDRLAELVSTKVRR
jgi:hypothetical protein